MSRAYRFKVYDLGRRHFPNLNLSRMTLRNLEERLLEYKVVSGAPRGGISIPFQELPDSAWARGLFPTGYIDIDYEILYRLPYKTLRSFFFLNKYFHNFLFTNQSFWYHKLVEHFKVPFPPSDPHYQPIWTYQRQYCYIMDNEFSDNNFSVLDVGDRTIDLVKEIYAGLREKFRIFPNREETIHSLIYCANNLGRTFLRATIRQDVLDFLLTIIKENPSVWRREYVASYLPTAWIRGDPHIIRCLKAHEGFELSQIEKDRAMYRLFREGPLRSICAFFVHDHGLYYKKLFLQDLGESYYEIEWHVDNLDRSERPLEETLRILDYVVREYSWDPETPLSLARAFKNLGLMRPDVVLPMFRQTIQNVPLFYRDVFLSHLEQECPPGQPLLDEYCSLGLYSTEESLKQGLYLSAYYPRENLQRFRNFLDLIEKVGCLSILRDPPFSGFLPHFCTKTPSYALEFYERARRYWIPLNEDLWTCLVTGYLTSKEYSSNVIRDVIYQLGTQYSPLGFRSENSASLLVRAISVNFNYAERNYIDLGIYEELLVKSEGLRTQDLENLTGLNYQKGSPEERLYGAKLVGLLFRYARTPQSVSLGPFWDKVLLKPIIRKEYDALEVLIAAGMKLSNRHDSYIATKLTRAQRENVRGAIARGNRARGI